ncbi:MAG: LysM peptidoglycan-binding domain-containing protein, partial [Anaerolinea sp.]|nr:LysM peptidoglycan-binding domain-containing protein [Anaerolinea sp.]
MKIRYAIAAVFIAVLIGLIPASAQTANPTGEGSTYVIQPDDTLWNIARAYDVTLEQILDANPGLNPYALPIGSEIVLPLDETSAAKGSPDPADPNPAAPLTGTVDYVVQEGDSLWALTYRFNVSFDALLAANPDVNIYAMSIGTVIQIPGQPNAARPIDVPVVEAPPSVLLGEPEVLSAPRISTNAGNASSLLIDEGLEPTPAPFIAPRAD